MKKILWNTDIINSAYDLVKRIERIEKDGGKYKLSTTEGIYGEKLAKIEYYYPEEDDE